MDTDRIKKKSDRIADLGKPLPAGFFQRPANILAPDLLGKTLSVSVQGKVSAGMIVEVEAYLGGDDPASHAFRGQTARNASMFAVGGTCYVYLSYGVHYCMNVVSGRAGTGEAVLIRAIQPTYGIETMCQRRSLRPEQQRQLANGPGKLTAALGLDLSFNGTCLRTGKALILDSGPTGDVQPQILTSPRIGISKGQDLPYRYYFAGSTWLSRRG